MTIEDARIGIGLTVRPVWATTSAHWILMSVNDAGESRIVTKRGHYRHEWVGRLEWTARAEWVMVERRRVAALGVSL